MDSTFLEKKHVYEQTPPILFVIEFIHEADDPTAKVGITFTVQYNFFQLINALLEKKMATVFANVKGACFINTFGFLPSLSSELPPTVYADRVRLRRTHYARGKPKSAA